MNILAGILAVILVAVWGAIGGRVAISYIGYADPKGTDTPLLASFIFIICVVIWPLIVLVFYFEYFGAWVQRRARQANERRDQGR